MEAYLDELPAKKQEQLTEWANQSEEHRALVEQLTNKQEVAKQLKEHQQMMDRMKERMKEFVQVEEAEPVIRKVIPLWIKCAAAALIVGIGIYYWLAGDKPKNEVVITDPPVWKTDTTRIGETRAVTLSDGSKIWLNAQSSVSYYQPFEPGTRKVAMKGEAYFEVIHDTTKPPFIVKAGNKQPVEITVLGTKFNVTAYDNNPPATAVLSGEVRVKNDKGSVKVNPGNEAVWDSTGKLYTKGVDTNRILYWKRDSIETEKVAIILEILGSWHNLKITYRNSSDKTAAMDDVIIASIKRQDSLQTALEPMRQNYEFEVRTGELLVKKKK